MALIPQLYHSATSVDGSTSTITDTTVYGAPELERNEVAVWLSAAKVDESNLDTPLEVTTFDPETATEFIVTNTVDGRYRYYFVIAPNWSNVTTYELGDLVWSTTENAFYQYINSTPAAGNPVTGTYFEIVADPSVLYIEDEETEPTNAYFLTYEWIVDYLTAKCYGTAQLKAAEEDCGGDCGCGCGGKTGKYASKLYVLLSVMRIANVRQRYNLGERYARTAEKYCDECGCLNQ
jgi:hypothetical protein